jgi:peptidyl-prolyl cis-trans isomerase A (cyclophilin A)
MLSRTLIASALVTNLGVVSLLACESSESSSSSSGMAAADGAAPQGPKVTPAESDAGDVGPSPLAACTRDPGAAAPSFDPASKADPVGGAEKFTLAMALAGFPAGAGRLTAALRTEKGWISCALDEAAAPISVANFVGLARGTRPYKTGAAWQVGKFYDGLVWHRVIPDFVIQGGDPDGVGTGGPGYDLVPENQVDEPLGTLAMAAAARPSGSQFYVVVGQGPAAKYNVFGKCTTENAVAIAGVTRDESDMPKTPVHIWQVEIGRCP